MKSAAARDPAESLRLCGEHANHYPQGTLSQEREVITITALLQLGRRSEAVSRAAAFKSRYPNSGHNRRLDVLLGEPPG